MCKNTERIAELNDAFRRSFVGGTVVLTPGVMALSEFTRRKLMIEVSCFDDFTKDNDPYGEHDFGSFDMDDVRFTFKIDYFADDLKHGSEDPADEKKTRRVMTIMKAEEM